MLLASVYKNTSIGKNICSHYKWLFSLNIHLFSVKGAQAWLKTIVIISTFVSKLLLDSNQAWLSLISESPRCVLEIQLPKGSLKGHHFEAFCWRRHLNCICDVEHMSWDLKCIKNNRDHNLKIQVNISGLLFLEGAGRGND